MEINASHPDISFKWRAVTAEFVGTFLFVFSGTCITTATVIHSMYSPLIVALVHGISLLTLVHIFGPISKGYFNPAVTLASIITRHIGVLEGVVDCKMNLYSQQVCCILLYNFWVELVVQQSLG